jgi:hypothetical protein
MRQKFENLVGNKICVRERDGCVRKQMVKQKRDSIERENMFSKGKTNFVSPWFMDCVCPHSS